MQGCKLLLINLITIKYSNEIVAIIKKGKPA